MTACSAKTSILRRPQSGPATAILRRLFKFASVLALLVALFLTGKTFLDRLGFSDVGHIAQMALPLVLLVFVVTAAIPFVPGAEIGFALLMIFGDELAVEVYLSMLCALLLAFCAGRLVPPTISKRALNLFVARSRLLRLRARNRTKWPLSKSVARIFERLFQNRHIALCAALNTPGNSILGGGGGLAFMAGASGRFSLLGFSLTASIAVLPVPLFFAMVGGV